LNSFSFKILSCSVPGDTPLILSIVFNGQLTEGPIPVFLQSART